MISTERSIIKYLIFTLCTCGIYALWYQYKFAEDVNTICEGDGKHTAGLLEFILFTILTLGIYVFVWYFCVGNRLKENAERYGVNLSGDGMTVLLWKVFGCCLFGLGSYVGDYILMRNTNILAAEYNKQHK